MPYNDNWKLDYNGLATSLYNMVQDLDQQQNDLDERIKREIRDRNGDMTRLRNEITKIKNINGLDDTNGEDGQFKRLDKTIYESKTEAEMSRVELVRDEIKNLIKNKEFSYEVSDKDNTAYIFVMGTNQRIVKISIDEIDENEETYKDYKRV